MATSPKKSSTKTSTKKSPLATKNKKASSTRQASSASVSTTEQDSLVQPQDKQKGHFITTFFSVFVLLMTILLTVVIFRPEIESYLRGTLGLSDNDKQAQQQTTEIVSQIISSELDKKYQNQYDSLAKTLGDLENKNQELESSLVSLQSDLSSYQDQLSSLALGDEEKLSQLLGKFQSVYLSVQRINLDILKLHIIDGLPFRAQLRNLDLSSIEQDAVLLSSIDMLKPHQDTGFSSYRDLSYRLEGLSICGVSESLTLTLSATSPKDSNSKDHNPKDSNSKDSNSKDHNPKDSNSKDSNSKDPIDSVAKTYQEQGWYDYISSLLIRSLSSLVKIRSVTSDSASAGESGVEGECSLWQSEILSILRTSAWDSEFQSTVLTLLDNPSLPKTKAFEDWSKQLKLSIQARLSVEQILSHFAPSPKSRESESGESESGESESGT